MVERISGADRRVPGYIKGYVRRFWQVRQLTEACVVCADPA